MQDVQGPDGKTYSVKYTHIRAYESVHPGRFDQAKRISSRGGTTIAELYDGDLLLTTGYADCHESDNYNKRIGRDISRGRALKQLADQQARSLFWLENHITGLRDDAVESHDPPHQ
jgi:hypothetical protein